jgi:hypothetical protein
MSPRSNRPFRLLTSPAESLFQAAVWIVVGAIGSLLVWASSPEIFVPADNYTSDRGRLAILSIPVVCFAVAIITIIDAIRRAAQYRAQQRDPEGIAARAAADDVAATKPYLVMQIVGVLLAVVWVFVAGSVILGFFITTEDGASVLVEFVFIAIIGLFAVGFLSAAHRRRSARKRVRLRTPAVAASGGPTLI